MKDQVIEHLEIVKEAGYFVDELHKNQIDEVGDEYDTQHAQDELECREVSLVEHPDFKHLDPDALEMLESNIGNPQSTRTIEIGCIDELNNKSRGYDKNQRKVVEIGLRRERGIAYPNEVR